MHQKRWTTTEISYLKQHMGRKTSAKIAKELGRTEIAVNKKWKRLGAKKIVAVAERVTSTDLARIIGIDRNLIYRWVQNHGLPAIRKVTASKRKFILISSEDFWYWAEMNKDKIDFRMIEKNALPPEPDWVELERKRSRYQKRNYTTWTTKEDEQLARLIDDGQTYSQIGDILNRTPISVERRYNRIKDNSGYYKGYKPYAVKKGERHSVKNNDIKE